jgi:hypothetical protein
MSMVVLIVVAETLREAGIQGIKYLDQDSRRNAVDRARDLEMVEENKADLAKERELLQEAIEQGDEGGRQINEDRIKTLEKLTGIIQKRLDADITHNYVVLDDKLIEITHRNGEPLTKEQQAIAADPIGGTVVAQLSENIEKAKKLLWLDPIIVPEAAGMSKALFERYSKHLQETQRALTKAVFDAASREIARRESKLWRVESAKEAETVTGDLEQRPDVKAERILRGQEYGEFGDFKTKFRPDDINDLFSAEEQRAMGGTPSELLRKDLVGEKDAMHPDEVAELSGHGSGRELVSDLIALERDRRERSENPRKQFERLVKEETTRRMEAKYGRLDERIMQEAMTHAMGVRQIQVLHDDLEKISAAGGLNLKVDKEMLAAEVRRQMSAMPHKEAIRVKDFEREVARAGEKAFKAASAEDWNEAFIQKQAQTYNALMLLEARRATKDVAAVNRTVSQLRDSRTIESWPQEYVDQGHGILRDLGEAIPRSEENLREALGEQQTYQQFVEKKLREEMAHLTPLPETFPNDFSRLTLGEMRQLKDTLESHAWNARQEERIIKGEKQEALDAVKVQIMDNLSTLRTRYDRYDESVLGGLKSTGRNIDATLLRMEQFMLWLDKNDPEGPFSQTIFRPLKEAQHYRDSIFQELAADWRALPGDKAWSKSLKQKLTNTVLLDSDSNLLPMTRARLISIMLNMGSEQNLRTLVKGRNWDEGQVRDYVWQNARKEDYEFVQGVWDMLAKQWPKIADAGRRNTGVAPERVPALPLDTPHGRYEGGYFPLLRDHEEAPVTGKKSLMDQLYHSPFVTQASMMKERTGAIYPVDLSLDQLPYKLRSLFHDVAYTEAVRNAAKVLQDPTIQKEIRDKFGPEYRDLMIPWLRNIAQDGGRADARAQAWLEKQSANARSKAVYMLIGWRPSTAAIHGGAAFFNSLYEAGPIKLAKAAGNLMLAKPEDILSATDQLFLNPNQTNSLWTWAMEQSGELRNRNHNLDRDIGEAQDRVMFLKSDWQKLSAYHATHMVSFLDLASAVPTWLAEYKAQRQAGKAHDDAVYLADVSVRQAHGSSGLMDQPAVQRMGESAKWFTSFYGYFSHNYNRQRNTGRELATIPAQVKAGDWKGALGTIGQTMWQSFAYLLAPAIIHELVRPHVAKPTDEEDSWPMWGAKALLKQEASTVPIVRDFAQAWVSGQKAQAAGPLGELVSGLTSPIADVHDALTRDEGMRPNALQHALELPGWALGFPMSRYSAGQWKLIWDVTGGDGPPPDADYWRLLMDGNAKPRKAH